jgi:TolA-binding protein
VGVSGERLQMIRVESGVAELRPRVGPPQLIAAGQTWSAAPPPLPTIAEAPVDREPGALPKAPLAPARSPPPVAEAEPAAPEPEPEPMVPATPDPSGAEEAFARGFGALRQGDFAPAAREFEALIEAYPGSPLAEDARFWRAVALAKSGAEAAAEEALRDFLARYPGTARSAEAALMLGWRRVAAGDTDEAGGWFRRAAAEGSPQLKARAEEALRYLLNPQERGR